MRRTVVPLILLLFTFGGIRVVAQNKPQEQKPTTPATTADTDEPKNEVEQMLAEAKKRGEPILATCIDGCKDADHTPDGFERGRAIALPKPAYSPLARAAHVRGNVQVQVIIGYDGKVIAAAVVNGHPLLQAACLEAARNSVFSPTKLEGKPVKVVGVLQYNFVGQ